VWIVFLANKITKSPPENQVRICLKIVGFYYAPANLSPNLSTVRMPTEPNNQTSSGVETSLGKAPNKSRRITIDAAVNFQNLTLFKNFKCFNIVFVM